MSEVQFEENEDMTFKSRKIIGEAQIPTLVKFLVDKGVTKSAKQAYNLLAICTVVFILVTIIIYAYYILGIGNPVQTKYETPIELQMQIDAQRANDSVTP